MRLEYFPATKRLYVVVDDKPVKEVEAWDGPSKIVRSHTMNAGPTDAGDFVIYSIAPYRTETWPTSRIKWGTRLKYVGSTVLYEEAPGKWRPLAKKIAHIDAAVLKNEYLRMYGVDALPERWVFNDFGPLAIRYFRDRNRDGRMNAGERLSGEIDRDALIALGAFQKGTRLKIHGYDVHFRYVLGAASGGR